MTTTRKEYLGDSVYIDFDPDGSSLVLTTENCYPEDPRNQIFLEPEVLTALVTYIKKYFSFTAEEKWKKGT